MAERSAQSSVHKRLRALYARTLVSSAPTETDVIVAVPIPGADSHRLGRDHADSVCLLLAAGPAGRLARPDIQLQNLSIRWRLACEITGPDGASELITGTLITCSAESEDVRRLFLDLFDEALDAIGPSPTEREVGAWIDHAVRLFAALEDSSPREIRGLWGELLVMCTSDDPQTLVRRWHEDPDDQFDFRAGDLALEVKTCQDLDRVHQFALRQLRPLSRIDVVIASVPVLSDPQGLSVLDLLTELESILTDPRVRARLREVTSKMGAAALASPNPARFDRQAAREGLRFMRAVTIPAIDSLLSAEILSVQLQVRCRDVLGEDLAEVVNRRLRA